MPRRVQVAERKAWTTARTSTRRPTGPTRWCIATEWNQFRGLDLERLKKLLASPMVVDLRNVYEPATMRERGFEYTGVGR